MQKKQKKGYVSITLKKAGCSDIVIESCPEKIKLNFLQLYLAMGFGCPALNVKPIDWKGVAVIYGTFFAPYIACFLFAEMEMVLLAIIALIGLFILNVNITKNYFFKYIKKHIAEGYEPETDEQRDILNKAGIPVTSSTTANLSNTTPHTQQANSQANDFMKALEKLAGLRDKGILTQEEFEAEKKKILANK